MAWNRESVSIHQTDAVAEIEDHRPRGMNLIRASISHTYRLHDTAASRVGIIIRTSGKAEQSIRIQVMDDVESVRVSPDYRKNSKPHED